MSRFDMLRKICCFVLLSILLSGCATVRSACTTEEYIYAEEGYTMARNGVKREEACNWVDLYTSRQTIAFFIGFDSAKEGKSWIETLFRLSDFSNS